MTFTDAINDTKERMDRNSALAARALSLEPGATIKRGCYFHNGPVCVEVRTFDRIRVCKAEHFDALEVKDEGFEALDASMAANPVVKPVAVDWNRYR